MDTKPSVNTVDSRSAIDMKPEPKSDAGARKGGNGGVAIEYTDGLMMSTVGMVRKENWPNESSVGKDMANTPLRLGGGTACSTG